MSRMRIYPEEHVAGQGMSRRLRRMWVVSLDWTAHIYTFMWLRMPLLLSWFSTGRLAHACRVYATLWYSTKWCAFTCFRGKKSKKYSYNNKHFALAVTLFLYVFMLYVSSIIVVIFVISPKSISFMKLHIGCLQKSTTKTTCCKWAGNNSWFARLIGFGTNKWSIARTVSKVCVKNMQKNKVLNMKKLY